MKQTLLYFLFSTFFFPVFAQYYLRGEVRDEKKVLLNGAKIFVHSNKSIYYSGSYGSFGITTRQLYDTLTITLNNYEKLVLPVKSDNWQNVTLQLSSSARNIAPPALCNLSTSLDNTPTFLVHKGDESYFQLVENDFVQASNFPSTGFSVGVNKASYSNVRRFINMGSQVPPDAVKVEEMINYFNLNYDQPNSKEVFRINTALSSCPWQADDQLLYINLSAKKLDLERMPPGNFVFLIDVSGSMDMPNRLPLIQAAFQMFVKNLRPVDKVSIVIYGGTTGIYLQPTSGADKEIILKAIEELTASGDTPGESAIRTAYKLAQSTFVKDGNNRIILATDGDFNVGERSENALDDLVSQQKDAGIYLTCLGVGMGNLKDSKLQVLAKKGNGNYAYLDDVNEAEKVLVKELTQTLYAVAEDVILKVDFNSEYVSAYRLIGFDNKKEALVQHSGLIEGGEVGSGSSTTAIFQIKPTAKLINDQLLQKSNYLAALQLGYQACGTVKKDSIVYIAKSDLTDPGSLSQELKLSTAITMFGLKLRNSLFKGNLTWASLDSYSQAAINKNVFLQFQFAEQVKKARDIYEPSKKKKKH